MTNKHKTKRQRTRRPWRAVTLAAALIVTLAGLMAAPAAALTPQQRQIITQIRAILDQASNSANVGVDDYGLQQKGAILGRSKAKKATDGFKNARIAWKDVSSAIPMEDNGWWVRVSGFLPGFWIQLGYFDRADDARRLAELINQMARLSATAPPPGE